MLIWCFAHRSHVMHRLNQQIRVLKRVVYFEVEYIILSWQAINARGVALEVNCTNKSSCTLKIARFVFNLEKFRALRCTDYGWIQFIEKAIECQYFHFAVGFGKLNEWNSPSCSLYLSLTPSTSDRWLHQQVNRMKVQRFKILLQSLFPASWITMWSQLAKMMHNPVKIDSQKHTPNTHARTKSRLEVSIANQEPPTRLLSRLYCCVCVIFPGQIFRAKKKYRAGKRVEKKGKYHRRYHEW